MRLTLNGQPTTVEALPERSLLHALREEHGLLAAKPGCGEGACGACTVLLDGVPIRSCVRPLTEVAGHAVETLEGLRGERVWRAVSDAFAELRAFQCGYCTPGMVVVAGALLRSNPDPSVTDIVAALDGNVCRCGTYPRIVRAVKHAAAALKSGTEGTARPEPTEPTDDRFSLRPAVPWDLSEPADRDWFARLGDGMVVVLTGDETEGVNDEGGWSTPGGGWLHVSPSGRVTAFTGKVDVGQDNTTALTALVADQMGVTADSVELVMGDTDFCPYDIGTFGSRSTEDAGGVLRAAAARARKWLAAHPDFDGVRHVEFARGDDAAPDRPIRRKRRSEQLERRRARAIAEGSLRYTTDMALPGMLHGRVLRPPAMGADLKSVDVAPGDALPGVVTLRKRSFVGVAATDPLRARQALGSIRATWRETKQPSETELADYLRSHPTEEQGWEGGFEHQRGNVDRALAAATVTLNATYTTAYIAHVPLETRCAVAAWEGDRVTIWTGTQRPFGVREQVAAELAVAEEQVRVIVPPTGAGYGGKHTAEAAVEAARLARACGRPVKVRWNRAEEFNCAYFRPAALIDVRAALTRRGRLGAWEFTNTNSGAMGIETPYRVANQRLRYQPADSPLRQGSYRALAATANNFARESAMDELAHLAGADPLQFRLDNLADERLAAVLSAAAERGGWGKRGRSAGRAVGLACGGDKGGRIATCVEVQQPKVGAFRVTRIVTAFDCGAIVDPDNLRNQVEGATVMGLGGALFEQVRFADGRITNGSLTDYRVPRFSDVPPIEVILLDQPKEPPAGAGETPIIAIAPAIANAIFAATGRRLRSLPLL